ncbi:MAG: hypothetical protein ACI9GW_000880 [Halieaceae bacterium]|jgi:uncharacterized protein (DUF58 family)
MQTSNRLHPKGAYCALEDLIALRYQGRQLKLLQRKKALSLLAGPNKTNFRGRGIDFEEVRAYQPGDDIRTIDWRVTARSGNAHTKIFREERERPVLIATDQRRGMFFGSQMSFKSVTAAYTSAILAWSGLNSSDRVGGFIFNEERHREVRPKRSRQNVLTQLHHLCEFNGEINTAAQAGFDFTSMLADLRRISRPGTAIFLVSDFNGADTESAKEQLYHLTRHIEVTAIHISDKLEAQLPTAGRYSVSNGLQSTEMFTGDSDIQSRYEQSFTDRVAALKKQFGRLGVPFIQITTEDQPLTVLQRFYGKANRRALR